MGIFFKNNNSFQKKTCEPILAIVEKHVYNLYNTP